MKMRRITKRMLKMIKSDFSANFKRRIVHSCYQKMARFEKKYIAKKNVIEKAAYDMTNGDPTFQKLRDRLFRSPAKLLLGMGLTANFISILGVFFAIAAAFSPNNAVVFSIFIVLNLICDGLDGVVARYSNTDNDFGSILDVSCDTFSLIVVSAGLYFYEYLSLAVFLSYSLIVLLYTYRAALKTKIIDKVFLSVGSRVVAFSGLAFIAILSLINDSNIVMASLSNALFIMVFSILAFAYFSDVLRNRKWK